LGEDQCVVLRSHTLSAWKRGGRQQRPKRGYPFVQDKWAGRKRRKGEEMGHRERGSRKRGLVVFRVFCFFLF
jgi:hypothetical protein